jgi:hypothetical protein
MIGTISVITLREHDRLGYVPASELSMHRRKSKLGRNVEISSNGSAAQTELF